MADQYASIIIDISHEDVDRVFQYRIPPALLPEIRVGVQVCVPFGSGNRASPRIPGSLSWPGG